MQLRHIFGELGQSLRRNLTMHLAVILTLFVSLTLVGLGALLYQQADKAEEHYGNQLEITAWLCRDKDPEPACATAVTDAQKDAIHAALDDNPNVESYRTESQQEAYDKAKERLGEDKFEGPDAPVTVDSYRESIWITLKNPDDVAVVVSAIQGLDGVSSMTDQRDLIDALFKTIDIFQYGAIGIAGFLILASLLLVGNTIRLAALARRREIAIMRLVGASSLYISLPFLIEALFTALVGVLLAGGALAALIQFGVEGQVADAIRWLPWVGWPEYLRAMIAVAILGPLLTLLPTLLLTRKYLKV